MQLPEWWEWEFVLSPHLLKRMVDRRFNEAELREMLVAPKGIQPNHEPGRWVVACRHAGTAWEVIVEPDFASDIVIVVTAYRVG